MKNSDTQTKRSGALLSKSRSTQRLALSGIMLALGTLLSVLTIYRLPYGGSITFFSMVPIMLLSYLFGVKWGMFCGFAYGLIQALLGAMTSAAFAGQNLLYVVLILFFDFIAAFSALGLAGMFRKKIKKPVLSFSLGCIVAGLVRYLMHFISGTVLFGSWAEWYFTQEGFPTLGAKILDKFSGLSLCAIYSAIYNGSYMIPEIIISAAASAALIAVLSKEQKLLKKMS